MMYFQGRRTHLCETLQVTTRQTTQIAHAQVRHSSTQRSGQVQIVMMAERKQKESLIYKRVLLYATRGLWRDLLCTSIRRYCPEVRRRYCSFSVWLSIVTRDDTRTQDILGHIYIDGAQRHARRWWSRVSCGALQSLMFTNSDVMAGAYSRPPFAFCHNPPQPP